MQEPKVVEKVIVPGRKLGILIDEDKLDAFCERCGLSPREKQMFVGTIIGLCPGEMVSMAKLSQKTISTYKRRLFDKLGISNIAELVAYAYMQGLITMGEV